MMSPQDAPDIHVYIYIYIYIIHTSYKSRVNFELCPRVTPCGIIRINITRDYFRVTPQDLTYIKLKINFEFYQKICVLT